MRCYASVYDSFEQYHLSNIMVIEWGKWTFNTIAKNVSLLIGYKKANKQYLPVFYTMSF